ncbi:MAG TPA: transposase family protein [Desulfobacterales bacterium]|nr:transposase family protein [Desulfobacterales bacterium]
MPIAGRRAPAPQHTHRTGSPGAAQRRTQGPRARQGHQLKHQVPVRTFSEWSETTPGFFEADLVAHCGESGHGEFAYTLTLTDVATGWTELCALPNRICDAIERVRQRLPVPLKGLDCDNGSEFINQHLLRYCQKRQITFTRCRPYCENDQCRVEGRNWSAVRSYTGYGRRGTQEAVRALGRLHSWVRISVDYLQPSMKLVEKVRVGARATRRYDQPATPLQRLIDSGILNPDRIEDLKLMLHDLNPAHVRRQIENARSELHKHTSVRILVGHQIRLVRF